MPPTRPLLATLLASTLLYCSAIAHADGPTPGVGVEAGSLVIVGGGGMPDAVRERFLALGKVGGGPVRLVVIPTASEDADKKDEEAGYLDPWRKYAPASLVLLHTRSRDRANTPDFARPIAEATAVWFSGGDQSKLIEAYKGTAVERELRALLARGGVIGGTSAGAAVMTDPMITGGTDRADVGPGFGFLRGAIVDQHFLRRSRLNRLLGVVNDRPGLVGIGIDEGTAFVVERDRWSVVGRSFVVALDPGKDGKPPRLGSYGDGDAGMIPPTGLPIPAKRPARAD